MPASVDPAASRLEVDALKLSFGGVRAIENATFHIDAGEVVGLIGPNGAGKTSLFNCITGFYRPTGGSIRLGNTSIAGWRPYRISRLGIRRTFQNIRLFNDLSVVDNIASGAHVVGTGTAALLDAVGQVCVELGIDRSLLMQRATSLAYGLQRLVELARALVANPRVLLVDEPGAGLNAAEKARICTLLRSAAASRGIGIALIEHDLGMIARACDRVVVLDHGMVISQGSPQQVRNDPAVIAAYIGA
jgi:branched-chain amino acid transport system ATP-binding protein